MRILVAEDDISTMHLLKMYLTRWDHECVLASDGNQAWDIFRRQNFDIVLSDWLMPGLQGPDLCKKIRSLKDRDYTYVILCSVKGETRSIVEGMEAGADDYITKPFERDELKVRLEAGRRLLELHRSLATTNERLERGLRQAALTLESMLPAPRNGPNVRLDWLFKPSAFIGGDIFNVFVIDDKRTGFYGIDVCGHGVASALFAVSLRNLIRPTLMTERSQSAMGVLSIDDFASPGKVAYALNNFFSQEQKALDTYFTMFYGVIDRENDTMHWVRAGHPPPIVTGSQNLQLDDGDQPIGMFSDSVYNEHKTELEPGDRIFLYSDGITEALNPSSEYFGIQKLSALLSEAKDSPLKQAVKKVEEAVDPYHSREFQDDLSLVAIELI